MRDPVRARLRAAHRTARRFLGRHASGIRWQTPPGGWSPPPASTGPPPGGCYARVFDGERAVAAGSPPADWIRGHGGDPITVHLIDLLSVAARLGQLKHASPALHATLIARLLDSDLPRLRGYLPARALAELDTGPPRR